MSGFRRGGGFRFQPALARRYTFDVAHFINREECRIYIANLKPGLGQGVQVSGGTEGSEVLNSAL